MTIKTVTGEDARIKMRDILDDVNTGAEVVIERYRRPAAVVVNYSQWQAWKRDRIQDLMTGAVVALVIVLIIIVVVDLWAK